MQAFCLYQLFRSFLAPFYFNFFPTCCFFTSCVVSLSLNTHAEIQTTPFPKHNCGFREAEESFESIKILRKRLYSQIGVIWFSNLMQILPNRLYFDFHQCRLISGRNKHKPGPPRTTPLYHKSQTPLLLLLLLAPQQGNPSDDRDPGASRRQSLTIGRESSAAPKHLHSESGGFCATSNVQHQSATSAAPSPHLTCHRWVMWHLGLPTHRKDHAQIPVSSFKNSWALLKTISGGRWQ